MREHLVERLGRGSARPGSTRCCAERRIVGLTGPIAPDAPYEPGTYLWFHRDLPVEAPVPFPIGVVYRDEHLVVVDKPHFLATIPRGQHIVETALVRLRRDLGLPDALPRPPAGPATAGLLMFVVRPEAPRRLPDAVPRPRGTKAYEAVAPYDPALALPRTVRSRIVKERGVIGAYEERRASRTPRPASSCWSTRAGLGRYRLLPATGRTHQLRLHMSGLGLPILGDDLYPGCCERPLDDFRRPLQLLAAALEFTDPVTGEPHRFATGLRLAAWSAVDISFLKCRSTKRDPLGDGGTGLTSSFTETGRNICAILKRP